MDNTALYISDLRRMRNKRKRQRQLKRNIFLSAFAMVLILTLSAALGTILVHAQSEDTDIMYKYYTSILVHSGDSLWSIASQNMNSNFYNTVDSYIDEIKQINALCDDGITSGQYLIIPYYSSEFLQ